MENNKLLIMITTYSRGENLPAVVESIVKQTFKNYKILICDDRSPNDPTEIINGIKSKYPNVNIEHHRNYNNIGEGLNINVALGREYDNHFKYLALLQDDTVYLDNNFLSNGIYMLEQNPDASYFGGKPNKLVPLINSPQNLLFVKINGLDFWRMWSKIAVHWAACIFRFDEIINYRLKAAPRKDVVNGDSLQLLNMAMKSYVIMKNEVVLDIEFNKTGQGYERFYKDPVDRFLKVEKYYRLASESAVEHGVSKQEAELWLLNQQLGLAWMAINRIGKNKEQREKFMTVLMDYDKKLSISIINAMLNLMIR